MRPYNFSNSRCFNFLDNSTLIINFLINVSDKTFFFFTIQVKNVYVALQWSVLQQQYVNSIKNFDDLGIPIAKSKSRASWESCRKLIRSKSSGPMSTIRNGIA